MPSVNSCDLSSLEHVNSSSLETAGGGGGGAGDLISTNRKRPTPPPRKISNRGQLEDEVNSSIDQSNPNVAEDEFRAPYKLLPAEYVQYYSKFTKNQQQILCLLSNFRFFVQFQSGKLGVYNILLRSIDSVECREIFYLYVYCKDGRVAKILFDNNETCTYWFRLISASAQPPSCFDDLFAFQFFENCCQNGFVNEENRDLAWRQNFDACEGNYPTNSTTPTVENTNFDSQEFDNKTLVEQEFLRLNFDPRFWRITEINKNYSLCPTYPKFWIEPQSISDQDVSEAAAYRTLKRVAAVVWRHRTNGAVLIRCSQPEPGIFGWRSPADENLLQAIFQAANADRKNNTNNLLGNLPNASSTNNNNNNNNNAARSGIAINSDDQSPSSLAVIIQNGHVCIPETANNPAGRQLSSAPNSNDNNYSAPAPNCNNTDTSAAPNKLMLILDARSYTAAWANRAKGGGYEIKENYQKCEVHFLGLANIHAIRSSFAKLRALMWDTTGNSDLSWFQNLDACQWTYHLWSLMNAALRVTEALHLDGRSVLVHCSDGWDRTTQIVSLAKLLLDSYYRTMKGFKELIEREWLAFGHKFGERSGLLQGDPNQRAPVFLQWLDCVHHLLRENPCSFEFNEIFLVKLAQHAYSGLFGTFLCNSACEFVGHKVAQRTFSIWSYLHPDRDQFRNLLYVPRHLHRKTNQQQPQGSPSSLGVLIPRLQLRDLGELWRALYCPYDDPANLLRSRSSGSYVGAHHYSNEDINKSAERSLNRAHSCDNLLTSTSGGVGHGGEPGSLSSNVLPSDGHHLAMKMHRTSSETSFNSLLLAKSNVNLATAPVPVLSTNPNVHSGGGVGEKTGSNRFLTEKREQQQQQPVFLDLFAKPDEFDQHRSVKFRRKSADDASLHSTPLSNNRSLMLSSLKSVSRDDMSLLSVHTNRTFNTNNTIDNYCRRRDSVTAGDDDPTRKILSAMNLTILTRAQVHQGSSSRIANGNNIFTSTTDLAAAAGATTTISPSTNDKNRHNENDVIDRSSHVIGQTVSSNNDINNADRLNIKSKSPPDAGAHVSPSIDNSAQPGGAAAAAAENVTSPPVLAPPPPPIGSLLANRNTSSSFDIDGLKKIIDPTQQRIKQIIVEYERRLKYRQLEIDRLKISLLQNQEQNNNASNHTNGISGGGCSKGIDFRNDHASADLFEPGSFDSRASEASWEAVEEKDAADSRPILWVPDHATTRCTNCDAQFWAIKRRHHCRNCGKVFCGACTNYECPVPQEQFFQPVRVCYKCYETLNQLPL